MLCGLRRNSTARDTRPRRPHEKRNPKPIAKVSLVYFMMCLKTRSWEPKQSEATRPPATMSVS